MAHRSIIMVKRTYLHIAILTLITAIVWMVTTIYQSFTAPSEFSVDATIRAPINPSFDEEVYNNIIGREDLSNLSFSANTASVSSITINEITTTPTENSDSNVQSTEVVTP